VADHELDVVAALDAAAQTTKLSVRNPVSLRRVGIVEEPGGELIGFRGQHRRDGVEQFVASRAGRHAKAKPVRNLRLADEKQARRFVGGQSSETCLETIQQLDAASPTARGEDWHARLAEGVDIAKDCSLGYIELFGELSRRLPATALQDLKHLQGPRRTHAGQSRRNMTEDVLFGLLRSAHD